MSTNRDVDRIDSIVRSWLREDAREDAGRVLEVVLQEVDTTSQRRAIWLARRFPAMNNPARIGIAAAVIAIAALIGFNYLSNQVGNEPSPTPRPSSAAPDEGLIPEALRHDFLGEVREASVAAGGDRSILNLTSTDFSFATGQTTLFGSAASTIGSELILVARDTTGGCAAGDDGRDPYALSPGESILTISTGTDTCASRAAAITGTWQRSDCRDPQDDCLGNIEAGTYSSQFFEPRPAGAWKARFGALTYTVPAGWAASRDVPETYALMPQADYAAFDPQVCSDCANSIPVFVNPHAAALDRAEAEAPGVGRTVDDLISWLRQTPGLFVGIPRSVTGGFGGLNATRFDVVLDSQWTGTCDEAEPFVAAPIFFNDYHLAIAPNDKQRIYLLDLGDGNTVAIVIDPATAADFDSFVLDADFVAESFGFPIR